MDVFNTLNLPKDVLLGYTIVTMVGQREAYIENFKKIIEYNDSCVRLKAKNGMVNISGRHLLIESYESNQLVIKGYIKDVSINEM